MNPVSRDSLVTAVADRRLNKPTAEGGKEVAFSTQGYEAYPGDAFGKSAASPEMSFINKRLRVKRGEAEDAANGAAE